MAEPRFAAIGSPSPEFRRQWGQFDELTDNIDPNLYEVVEIIDRERSANDR
jgi:hypothetical protein